MPDPKNIEHKQKLTGIFRIPLGMQTVKTFNTT